MRPFDPAPSSLARDDGEFWIIIITTSPLTPLHVLICGSTLYCVALSRKLRPWQLTFNLDGCHNKFNNIWSCSLPSI